MGAEELASGSTDWDTDRGDEIATEILERLRPRERDVLFEFRAEPNVKRIAKRLGLSQGTVVNYLTSIQQHLRVSSQAELMKLILTRRLPDIPPPPES